jgi:hypothetical protein
VVGGLPFSYTATVPHTAVIGGCVAETDSCVHVFAPTEMVEPVVKEMNPPNRSEVY